MASSKISVFLRASTDELAKTLRDNGFLNVQPERESELSALLEKFNDEMYGSSGSPRRQKQSEVRVVSETPVTYDRDYLNKQSVQELLRIAKAKGCKNLGPRKKETIIEKLLIHLATPHAEQPEVSSQNSDITAVSDAPTEDELHPEPVPEPPAEPPKEKKPRKKKEAEAADADAPAKKGRKKKDAGSDDETKPKKEKKKPKDPAPASDEEVTIAVRQWIHPKEQDRPPSERTRYCIDPITNYLYNPDQLTDDPIGKWDDESQEIIPL